MPYLKIEDKKQVEDSIIDSKRSFQEIGACLRTPGELNYTITRIIQGYFKAKGGKYQHANDILGALEGAKLEFYRRTIAPYEDQKIKENGDVS